MNATQNAQSLLSLPPGVTAPDPYTVLGVQPGESDPAKIATAIKSVVARLNSVKATADPAAWNQAATWVKESRRIVSDPALKARLDQKMGHGVSSASASASASAAAPTIPQSPKPPAPLAPQAPAAAAFDPLAGFLPGQSTSPPAPIAAGNPGGPGNATNAAFRPGNAPPAPVAPQPPGFVPRPGFVQAPAPYAAVPPMPGYGPAQPVGVNPGAADYGQQGVSAAVAVDPVRELAGIAKPQSASRRRKKRFPWASLILVLLTLVSIGGIVAMVVYLTKNPGGITIALQPGVDGAVPVAGSNLAVAPPIARDDSPPDPIMGRLSPGKPGRDSDRLSATKTANDSVSNGPSNDEMSVAAENSPNPDRATANPAMAPSSEMMPDAAAITDPGMANIPEGDAPPTVIPNMAEIPGVVEPTSEQLEMSQAALVKAREVLASAKWDEMNAAAEAAVKAAATPEQKKLALQLVQLAELATYYHVGVEKALDGLKANETFNVTEQLQVSLVEITPQKVVLRFNGRNKDYNRAELPLVIAHKIASFTMPVDAPATKAAAQVYQSLAPVTTPQYREQAVKALEAMPPQPDDVDPADLVAAIRQVFPN